MAEVIDNKRIGRGCLGWGCLFAFLLPIILFFIPFPETPIKTYPVSGKSNFDVLDHKVILSLGAFEQYEQSQYGMKRHFHLWTDVSNDRWGKDSVTLKCNKLEYRIDGSSWREAERTPEGDYQGGGSARVWYWSPLIQDLELIDAKSESYKMRVGRYDIRVDFEGVDGSRKVIETTFTLGEKMVQHWTSVREILEELSGIN